MCRRQRYFFLSGLHYYFWGQSWAARGDEDKHHSMQPTHGLPVSLGCAQDGRESWPAAVPHMVAGRDLIGRKMSIQSLACVPVSCVSCLRQQEKPQEKPTLFKFSVNKLTQCLWKRHQSLSKVPKASQNISEFSPHPISNKGTTEGEICFSFIHSPSVPCWQHKRMGKWKQSLRKTLYRRKAFICLCLIVPWTLSEKMVALCQLICQTVLWHGPHWRCYEHGVLWLPYAWNTLNLCRVCSQQMRKTGT